MLFNLCLTFLILLSAHAQATDFNSIIKSVTPSPYIGQGNPKVTQHPVTREQCLSKLANEKISYTNKQFKKICHDDYMAPLYDPSQQKASDAQVCIDQFEYPNQPCEYPIVWVRASEAAKICEALGKRLCDAHEWEGACSGKLMPPDYNYQLIGKSDSQTIKLRRQVHNKQANKSWAYGPKRRTGICGAASIKSDDCNGGDWAKCGSNTYPSGYFPQCKSALGVYDQHGNAAEHMNLPLTPQQSSSHSSGELGHTEMKGSWFIFDHYYAHDDWCKWRAPYWHGSRVRDNKSHHNYHLGFRCCKDIARQ